MGMKVYLPLPVSGTNGGTTTRVVLFRSSRLSPRSARRVGEFSFEF